MSSLKTLAIGDQTDNLIHLSASIRAAFSEVLTLTAENGQAGMELALLEDPDVVLLDMHTPGMDGLEVCQKLKSNPSTCQIPVVFLTAGPDDKHSRVQALSVGADGFLAKPIDETELTVQIRAMQKVKAANRHTQLETETLAQQVAEKTRELNQARSTTLHLLEGLRKENEIRRKNEIDLHKTKQSLEEAQRISHLGNWTRDLITNRSWWSDEVFRIFGRDPELGAPTIEAWLDRIYPEDREAVQCALQKALAVGNAQMDYRLIRYDNAQIRWVNAQVKVTYAGEKPVLLHGVTQDITERKQIEEALRANEERYRLLYERSPLGYQSLDSDGCFIEVNQSWLDTLGYEREEVIGHWFGDFLIPEMVSAFRERFPRFKAAGEVHNQFQMIHKDGRILTVSFDGKIGYDAQGRFKQTHCIINDITARRIMEEALQESEKRFRLALQNAPLPIMLHAEDGEVILINRAWTQLSGYTLAEMPTTTVWSQKAYGDRGPMVKHEIEQLYQLEAPVDEGEFVIRTKDGKELTWDFSSSMLGKLPDGRRLVISMAKDVTERKEAEDKIHFQFSLLNAVGQAVIATDLQGKVIYFNQAAEELYGWPAAEAMGRNIIDINVPETAQPQAEEIMASLQAGQTWTGEFWVKRRDGTIFPAIVTDAPVKNEAGKLIAIIGVSTDITQRKKAEEELRRIQLLLNETQRITRVGGWEYDPSTNQVSWTDEVYRIYGLSKTYDPSRSDQDIQFYAPEDQQKITKAFNLAVEKGEPYDLELQLINAQGDMRWVRTIGQVESRAGKIIRVFGNIMDITERKQTEEKLHAAYLELKQLLEEADHSRKVLLAVVEDQKITQEELNRLNDELDQRVKERTLQLEAANRELEAFSYSVSHDLRAPLRGIDGFSSALLEDYPDRLDEPGRHLLERIRSETRRMGHMIDDTLQLSRIMRIEMKREPANLTQLAHLVLDRLQETEGDRQVRTKIDPDLMAYGDPNLLEIMLTNLLSNAWKFTGKQPQPVIEFGKTLVAGQPAFFIRDNGAGFDMAYAKNLFGAFQRMHSQSEFPGTGIGLATVQRIIHRHGGKVWAEAQKDVGATFYFTIEEKR